MTIDTYNLFTVWHIGASLASFVFGACIGSFLNVCIYRIPRELSVVTPRSHCISCGRMIPWYLNLPLVSYLLLRGKCKYCGASFSPRYLIVEALTAVLFLLTWLKYVFPHGALLGMTPAEDLLLIPVYWLMIGGLILGTFVDFEHLIIPDRVTLGGIAAGLILSVAVPSLHNSTSRLISLGYAVTGATAGWMILWLIGFIGKIIFRKEAMGFGDVKLIGAMGAFLGWKAVLFIIGVSSFFGAIIGIILVLSKRREMQSRIPYGPYLSLAAIIWIFWGETLWNAYMSLLSTTDINQ